MNNDENEYLSYNVLARKALYRGVPFMLGLIIFILIILSSFLALALSSKLLIIIPASLILLLFVIKVISENDSLAVDKLKWSIKGLILRIKQRSFILNISPKLTSDKKRTERISDFFKQHQL
jgi:type IV secretion system protein VirB3